MKPVARIFNRGEQARAAVEKLESAGYDSGTVIVLGSATAPKSRDPAPAHDASTASAETPLETTAPEGTPGGPSGTVAKPQPVEMSAQEVVTKAKPAGDLHRGRAAVLSRALGNGKAVVIVGAPYGHVVRAHGILDGCGAEPAAALDVPPEDNPSPFSDFLGLPTLDSGLSFLSSDNPLKDPHWTAFPVKLKDKTTTKVKLRTFLPTKPKVSNKLTTNPKLSDKPAWLSSKLGLRTLAKQKNRDHPWRTSFGFKLLSKQKD